LNRFPQGAPPSHLLYKILGMLFSEREAWLIASLQIKPFTSAKAARIWKKTQAEARTILETRAGRGLLFDSEHDGTSTCSLPTPMAGFF
jgi:hypothetical protein